MPAAGAVVLLLALLARGDDRAARPEGFGPPIAELVQVRRIYVDRLNGNDGAAQIRDMIISALEQSKLFVITENEARADAILKGSAEDLIFTDVFQSSESVHANATISTGSNSTYTSSTSSRRNSRTGPGASAGLTESDSTRIQERKHEASASVRLVNRDGDVLWSTTQESLGAKFKGSAADVADKVAKKLVADVERARRPPPAPPSPK
jgi:hypothetical protein